ncbi:MAG: CDP-diacylglycerol--glycerol-3-phosphate 3-phosphatidyltransferase [Lachnospiraceae bacterium]|nr:CDP-diacylglycerol--glycerol-3-phosphate 3-phosphatidyltransferase [Lachnospiraceae bacterium]
MNLPNKLTCLRVIMIPFFVIAMILSLRLSSVTVALIGEDVGAMAYGTGALGGAFGVYGLRHAAIVGDPGANPFVMWRWIAFVIFCLASFTDFLDGYIARKNNLVTDFGKFMDPLADKLLVCSALILLTAEGSLPAWVVIIIIAREFIISGFRLVAADNGIVIAASWWGKFKTVSQMLLCMLLILPKLPMIVGDAVITVLTAIVVLLTLISLIDYMTKNIKVITEGGM